MQVGMMNNPAVDAVEEARWAAANGFDFLDLTVEGPSASRDRLDVKVLHAVLDEHGLGIMGHTAWYLPFASPVPEVRAGAVQAVTAIFEPLAQVGAKLVNVHVDKGIIKFPYDDSLRWNAESFAALAEKAKSWGLKVMIENVINQFNTAKAFRTLLAAHPDLLFHLDIGHANVKGERTEEFLKAHSAKLAHVHISDNNQVNDDHLPMGVGSIKWPEMIGLLKRFGYDGTITLEIFTPDRSYLLENAQRLRNLWSPAEG
ncbi:MAG: sugar phosphate isomerase/epimerase [Herpetosiphonaceae bacterium]|nr:sugar phosphate isomerase/epimerase [Herpetosiphonaceae bacterium]